MDKKHLLLLNLTLTNKNIMVTSYIFKYTYHQFKLQCDKEEVYADEKILKE